jgi:tRNA pseudouridine65 synthase
VNIDVLAQGSGWLVVGKPSGLPVHRSAMVNERDTLVRRLRRDLGFDVDPVHRLDRPPSGCLLLSSDRARTGALQAALTVGHKRYVAFVRGRVQTLEPVVFDNPMADSHGVVKEAQTVLIPIAGSAEPRCSVVVASPLTGRFHQVRRHLRDLSHPVLGDSTHGDTRVNRFWREGYGLHRLALHCLSLSLQGPEGPIEVTCPLPDELVAFGEQLPFWPDVVNALPDLVRRGPGA